MKITGVEREAEILTEIGLRIKQRRIGMNITQDELARRCRMSTSTEVRIENGDDTKLSNIIKLLKELGLGENLDFLIPETHPDYKVIWNGGSPRKRALKRRKITKKTWVWGEDK